MAVVALPAEIDAANVAMVEAILTCALASRPPVLIADGTTTAFCDCSGIAALTRAHHQATTAGTHLRVVVTSTSVRRVLGLTGADQLLLVYPSLADAQVDRSQYASSAGIVRRILTTRRSHDPDRRRAS